MTETEVPAAAGDRGAGLRLDGATSRSLEFDTLRAVLAGLAATDLGRERLARLAPARGPEELEERRSRFRAISALIAEDGSLVASFEEPLAEARARLRRPRPAFPGRELHLLGSVLLGAADAAARLRAAADEPAASEAPEPADVLRALLADIGCGEESGAAWRDLALAIHGTLDADGAIRPDASPELRRRRGALRQRRATARSRFESYVAENAGVLGDETLSSRDDRLTVLLPAGSRGRIEGLSHGRSASGQSFYFEPLELVEVNNDVSEAHSAVAAEEARLLDELAERVNGEREELLVALELLAVLDELQAATRFAELAEATLPRLGPDEPIHLVGGRHPLLDERLRDLRGRTLEEAGHAGTVVPLDLDSGSATVVVVTGPNAGGKTVALKTVGLLVVLAACGWPVPAAPRTRLPLVERLVAVVGDEQDLFRDRSTFSARLLRFQEAWEAAGERALVLVDELGSGTNPEEGAALAVALLEHLVARRSRAILTTHLLPVASAALGLDGASVYAMELEASGVPTFRPREGAPGSSHALDLARRLGLAKEWIGRAETLLGDEYRSLQQLLAEAEEERDRVRESRRRAELERQDQEKLRSRLAEELERAKAERDSDRRRFETELVAFRKSARQELRRAVEGLRKSGAAPGRRADERALDRVLQRAARPEAAKAPRDEASDADVDADAEVEEGATVRHRGLGWSGAVEELRGDRATVLVRGKKVRCPADQLVVVRDPASRSRAERRASVRTPEAPEVPAELNLVGQRVAPALDELERYLDSALRTGLERVRIIHGHGTGRLRQAVREDLRGRPGVARFARAEQNEGGDGATIVELRR